MTGAGAPENARPIETVRFRTGFPLLPFQAFGLRGRSWTGAVVSSATSAGANSRGIPAVILVPPMIGGPIIMKPCGRCLL